MGLPQKSRRFCGHGGFAVQQGPQAQTRYPLRQPHNIQAQNKPTAGSRHVNEQNSVAWAALVDRPARTWPLRHRTQRATLMVLSAKPEKHETKHSTQTTKMTGQQPLQEENPFGSQKACAECYDQKEAIPSPPICTKSWSFSGSSIATKQQGRLC